MKTLSLVVTLVTLTAFTGPAMADDADDVRATIEQHYSHIQTVDLEPSVATYHLDDFTMFLADGGVLWETDFKAVAERMGATVDMPRSNVRMTDFRAQIYDDVAVVTFYLVGTHGEGDETRPVTNRVSAVWVKTGREWKEAHHHESPLDPRGLR
jgi:ketosteroid isomerase-like protein